MWPSGYVEKKKLGMEIPKMRFGGVCKQKFIVNVWLDGHRRGIETLVSIALGCCHGVTGQWCNGSLKINRTFLSR